MGEESKNIWAIETSALQTLHKKDFSKVWASCSQRQPREVQ
jgi:hypothetical protein